MGREREEIVEEIKGEKKILTKEWPSFCLNRLGDLLYFTLSPSPSLSLSSCEHFVIDRRKVITIFHEQKKQFLLSVAFASRS